MMDKMREEFENYYVNDLLPKLMSTSLFGLMDAEDAKNFAVVFFDTWKKSRAALVVELPETCCRTLVFEQENTLEVGMVHDEYFEVDDIHEALDKAGVKYKVLEITKREYENAVAR